MQRRNDESRRESTQPIRPSTSNDKFREWKRAQDEFAEELESEATESPGAEKPRQPEPNDRRQMPS